MDPPMDAFEIQNTPFIVPPPIFGHAAATESVVARAAGSVAGPAGRGFKSGVDKTLCESIIIFPGGRDV